MATLQVKTASRPTGTVTLLIVSVNSGSKPYLSALSCERRKRNKKARALTRTRQCLYVLKSQGSFSANKHDADAARGETETETATDSEREKRKSIRVEKSASGAGASLIGSASLTRCGAESDAGAGERGPITRPADNRESHHTRPTHQQSGASRRPRRRPPLAKRPGPRKPTDGPSFPAASSRRTSMRSDRSPLDDR